MKERLANVFLPHVSLSSRGAGNRCWQQVYSPAVPDLPSVLGSTPLWSSVCSTAGTQPGNLISSEILLFTSLSCTDVAVKALFNPAGDVQSGVRMPSAVPWAPLAHADTSCVARSWCPGEREMLFQRPALLLLRRVSKVIWLLGNPPLSLLYIERAYTSNFLICSTFFLEQGDLLYYWSQILLGCTKTLRWFSLAIVLTCNTLQGLLITESPYASGML